MPRAAEPVPLDPPAGQRSVRDHQSRLAAHAEREPLRARFRPSLGKAPVHHSLLSRLTQKSGSPSSLAGNMRCVRVLIVEDERKLAQALASALRGEHYD